MEKTAILLRKIYLSLNYHLTATFRHEMGHMSRWFYRTRRRRAFSDVKKRGVSNLIAGRG